MARVKINIEIDQNMARVKINIEIDQNMARVHCDMDRLNQCTIYWKPIMCRVKLCPEGFKTCLVLKKKVYNDHNLESLPPYQTIYHDLHHEGQ